MLCLLSLCWTWACLWETLLLSFSLGCLLGILFQALSPFAYVTMLLLLLLPIKRAGWGGEESVSFQGLHSVIFVDFCIFEMLFCVCFLNICLKTQVLFFSLLFVLNVCSVKYIHFWMSIHSSSWLGTVSFDFCPRIRILFFSFTNNFYWSYESRSLKLGVLNLHAYLITRKIWSL